MLRVLRIPSLVLTALIVTVCAVSAQSVVPGSCESILRREGKESGRSFLGLKECYNCHTNGFPKDGFGDRFGITANDNWILANEVRIWGENDKHSQAYTSLLSDTARKMGEAMGVPGTIHRDKRCLACHTGFPIAAMTKMDAANGLIDEKTYQNDLRITTGVSCEGCHGSAGGDHGWLTAHTSKDAWRFLTPDAKCEKGYYDVRSVISRTKLCLSCHLGNAAQGRILTHEMYAAGHPPLPPFELATFEELMPKHWRNLSEKKDLQQEYSERTGTQVDPEELRGTKSLLVAALISRSEALRLTADLAADLAEGAVSNQIPKPQWPDFAQFDCYACHHDLKSEGWRTTAQHRGSPGRPPLVPWPNALSRLAAIQAQLEPNDIDRDFSFVQSAILKSPFGDREQLIAAARASANLAETTAAALSGQDLRASEGMALLERIAETAATETMDYDSARQLVWAFEILRTELQPAQNSRPDSSLLHGDLTEIKSMFVLDLKDAERYGQNIPRTIPGASEERTVNEVKLEKILPPIAEYDALKFREAFSQLRQPVHSSAESRK